MSTKAQTIVEEIQEQIRRAVREGTQEDIPLNPEALAFGIRLILAANNGRIDKAWKAYKRAAWRASRHPEAASEILDRAEQRLRKYAPTQGAVADELDEHLNDIRTSYSVPAGAHPTGTSKKKKGTSKRRPYHLQRRLALIALGIDIRRVFIDRIRALELDFARRSISEKDLEALKAYHVLQAVLGPAGDEPWDEIFDLLSDRANGIARRYAAKSEQALESYAGNKIKGTLGEKFVAHWRVWTDQMDAFEAYAKEVILPNLSGWEVQRVDGKMWLGSGTKEAWDHAILVMETWEAAWEHARRTPGHIPGQRVRRRAMLVVAGQTKVEDKSTVLEQIVRRDIPREKIKGGKAPRLQVQKGTERPDEFDLVPLPDNADTYRYCMTAPSAKERELYYLALLHTTNIKALQISLPIFLEGFNALKDVLVEAVAKVVPAK